MLIAEFLVSVLGPRPPAGPTLALWATGLLEEESGLMRLGLRSLLIGPRHTYRQGVSARVNVLHA